MFWSLVLLVCYNGECEDWVVDQSDTIQECVENMRKAQFDLEHMDKEKRYALTCEQTEEEAE